MSDTNLNISISATDGAAQASLKAVQATVKNLSDTLQQLTALQANASVANATNIGRETAAIKAKIAALNEEAAALKALMGTSASAAQAEANYINRNMDLAARQVRQRISLSNQGAVAAQQAAEDSARYEAEAINRSMALREQAVRQSIAANNARVRQQREQEETAQRAEADHTNNNLNAVRAQQRAEAEYINQTTDVQRTAAQQEAEYINRNHDMTYAAMRREADLENQNFDLRARAAKATEGPGISSTQMARHGVSLFDSLARGQRGQALSSIGAAARDAGFGVAALTTSMGGLIALVAGEAILRGAENMGKWATQSEAAASAAGMGLAAYSQLQGALTLTGVKADSADSALRRIAVNLGTALADPASKVAEAFHALGISQEQLIATGGDVGKLLHLLADAFVQTADGANKSAAMSAIAGRGYETIIPALQHGGDAFDALKDKALSLGMTLDESSAKTLENLGRDVEDLTKSIEGGAIKAFIEWAPAIQGVVALLGTLGSAFGTVLEQMGRVASFPSRAATAIDNFLGIPDTVPDVTAPAIPAGPKRQVPPMSKAGGAETVMDSIHNQMALARSSASGGGSKIAEDKAEINSLQQLMATEVLTDKQREQLSTELMNKVTQLNNEMATSGGKAAKQSYADFASAERLKIGEAEGSSAKIKSIYDEWINAAIAKYKQLGSVVDELKAKELEAVNAAKRSEIKSAASSDEQQAKLLALNTQLAQYQGGDLGRPTKSSGPQQDMRESQTDVAQAQQIAATAQAEITALRAAGATAQETLGIEMEAKSQEVALYQKAAEAAQEAAKKIAAPFIELADSVGSTLESGFKGLFTDLFFPQIDLLKQGLTTIKVSQQGNELRALFQKTFIGLASDFGNAMETAIGHMAAQALSGGASNTMGELIGSLLSKAFSSIVGSTVGSAAGQAAGSAVGGAGGSAISSTAIVTGVDAGLTTLGTTLGGVITGTAATSTADITGLLTTLIGVNTVGFSTLAGTTAATAVKPEAFGFSYAGGGVVPSAAGGMVVGGNGASLAMLHTKEMVLPEPISSGLQQMISRGGGGGGVSNSASLNYAPTIHTGSRGRGGTGMTRSEFSQLLSLNSGAMLGQARGMMNSGWRPG